MILGEKSAAVNGGERPPDQQMPKSGFYAFSEVVDKACEGLMERHVKYSIRRICEMENQLCEMERELNDFLFSKKRK